MKKSVMMVATSAAVVLAGCGGGGAKLAAETTQPPSPVVTTAAEPDVTVSPKLFAAAAARAEVKIGQLKQDLGDCADPENGIRALTCQMILSRAPVEGRLVVKDIMGIGSAPEGVADVVWGTVFAADELGKVDTSQCEAIKEGLADRWFMECTGASLEASRAIDALLEQLAGLKVVG